MSAFFEKKAAPVAVVAKAGGYDKRVVALGALILLASGLMFVPQDRLTFWRAAKTTGADFFAALKGGDKPKPIPRDARPADVNTVKLIYAKPGLAEELGTPVNPPPGGKTVGGILSGAEEAAGGVTMDLPPYLRTSGGAGSLPESVAKALDAVPVVDPGEGMVQGGTHGRLPRQRAREMSAEVKQTLSKPREAQGKKAFAQLASSYSRALAAVGPMASEASAATSGSLYDGLRAPDVPDRLAGAAPAFDGASLPQLHDPARIAREARRLQTETRQCQAAEAQHASSKAEQMKVMDREAAAYRDGNCRRWTELKTSCRDGGGMGACALSRALTLIIERCEGRASRATQACREHNRLECLISRACPTVAAQGCSPVDCEALLR